MPCDSPTDLSSVSRKDVLVGSVTVRNRPRMRAYSPKVRTGCITCKTRRKKCDEEKPICRRCKDDQFKCDGYAPVRTRKNAAMRVATPAKGEEKQIVLLSNERRADRHTPYDLLFNTGLTLDPEARRPGSEFLHHFLSITIVDFIRITNPDDFWFRRVLPICHDDPVVRQVLVALGAAHRCYLDNLSKPSLEDMNAPLTHFEGLAVSLYNEAIAKLINFDVKSSTSGSSELKFLMCCLLFVCLEYMLGRFDEAVRHIKAGCQLLQESNLSTAPEEIRQLFQEAGTVFLRFIVDATIPPQQYEIPNMISHAKPLIEVDDGSQPFKSLAEARDAIWDMDVRMAYSEHPRDELREPFQTGEKPHFETNCEIVNEEWEELSAAFGIWKSKYNLLVSSYGDVNLLPLELQREILVLTAQRYMWDIILYAEYGHEDEGLRILCNEYIDVVERAYAIEASTMGRPVFTLDSDTIPAMFHTATYCKDPVFKERVIALLRQYKRREGLWDSAKVADMLATGSYAWDYDSDSIA